MNNERLVACLGEIRKTYLARDMKFSTSVIEAAIAELTKPARSQSPLMSAIESVTNVAVGYGLAVWTQLLIFPWFGLPARLGDAVWIGMVFTVVSLVRSYVLRRIFNNGWLLVDPDNGADKPSPLKSATARVVPGEQ